MKSHDTSQTDEIPFALIADSRIAAILTDARQKDNPIVACNEAFVTLTGYPRNEIIGRNCRFLQGEQTAPHPIAILREAVAAGRPALAELLNYRRDGSTFHNAVMIAPLFDDEGKVAYFLGSQMIVDDVAAIRQSQARSRVAGLTRRQLQVLAALAAGRLNKQIAFELGVTERTVKMHRAALLRALGVRTAAEAIRLVIEAGLQD